MARSLLTEEQFSRVVVTRVRRERPDIRVKSVGKFFLMVEPEPGRRRVVSLLHAYRTYCDSPTDRDAAIRTFLTTLVYEEPNSQGGSFEENRHKVMPQVVPPSLLTFCRRDGRELASMNYVGSLSIAFVIDEPERYSYLQRQLSEEWGVSDTLLLATAIQNLQALNRNTPRFDRFGKGDRLTLVWETFDGYDASRILLTRELTEMAALVSGNPLIAIPHRDYLVMFGDADADFVQEMADRVRVQFESHGYPITSRVFTLMDGTLEAYDGPERHIRILN